MPKKASILFVLLLALLASTSAYSQDNYFLVKGQVSDSTNAEKLPYAEVTHEESGMYTYADSTGQFALKLPKGKATLVINFIGYKSVTKSINVTGDMTIDVTLSPDVEIIEEFKVTSDPYQEKLNSTQMSTEKITIEEAKKIPALMGEVDIIKTIQLKPGVQSGFEGSTGLYVRGGGPDQNLILLDDAVIYNPSHLFGLFSVFNGEVVKDIELYKGGFPSRFGGRLSSILEVNTRKGDYEKLSGSGGIGLISSRATLTGPIKKGKSSFLLSGRRTYFDIFTNMINKGNEDNEDFNPIPGYFFYDLNGKVDYKIGEKDWIELSGYLGRDRFKFDDGNFEFKFLWGNSAASLSWRHEYSPKLFSKVTAIYTDYRYQLENTFDVFSFKLGSNIKDYGGKVDYSYYPTDKHTIRFGASYTFHDFTVSRLKVGSEDNSLDFDSDLELAASEMGIYISDDYKVNDDLRLTFGLRGSGFLNDGKFYYGIEPRFASRYFLNKTTVLKASYARMNQYIHLVSSSGSSLPTDIWFPSTKVVKPQRSDQIALGIGKTLKDGKYFFSNEVYYKWLDNQVDFRDNAQLFVNEQLEQEFVFGRGTGYGNEIYIEKKKGKTTGWIGYTLSWASRWFDEINDGEKTYPRYDRRHDISAVVMHELSERVTVSAAFVFGTGITVTQAFSRLDLQDIDGTDNSAVPVYSKRNNYRLPAYHRLDLGLVWDLNSKWGESDLTFSIYNVYNRRNTYFIFFDEELDEDDNVVRYSAKQVSLFPIIPAVTYNFKF